MHIQTTLLLTTIAMGCQVASAQPAPPQAAAVVSSSPGKYSAASVVTVPAAEAGVAQAKPPFAITHKPGHMFLTDLTETDLDGE